MEYNCTSIVTAEKRPTAVMVLINSNNVEMTMQMLNGFHLFIHLFIHLFTYLFMYLLTYSFT
jgi:hypothetical protein